MAKFPKNDVGELLKENESLKSIANEYKELKTFAQEVVEKYNVIASEYNDLQEDAKKIKAENEALTKELAKQKEISATLDKRLTDFQNHINDLIDKFNDLSNENEKNKSTIVSLEKYIEVMDKKPHIRNERGAGRKRKYSKEDIMFIVNSRNKRVDYEEIRDGLIEKTGSNWEVKDIKYIYSRYKNDKELEKTP